MRDRALSNYIEAVILKGPSVLEAGQWSMAGPSLSVRTPIYLSSLFNPLSVTLP